MKLFVQPRAEWIPTSNGPKQVIRPIEYRYAGDQFTVKIENRFLKARITDFDFLETAENLILTQEAEISENCQVYGDEMYATLKAIVHNLTKLQPEGHQVTVTEKISVSLAEDLIAKIEGREA